MLTLVAFTNADSIAEIYVPIIEAQGCLISLCVPVFTLLAVIAASTIKPCRYCTGHQTTCFGETIALAWCQ